MTNYNVHIHREVRLTLADIEADSPEDAVGIARSIPTGAADRIDDCEDLSARVGLAGDNWYEQSRTIDFESERMRKAAPELLAACRMVVARWEHGDLAEAARACSAAIAEAEAASPPSEPAALSRYDHD